MRKRIVALLICALMIFSFTACSESKKTQTDAITTAQDASTTEKEVDSQSDEANENTDKTTEKNEEKTESVSDEDVEDDEQSEQSEEKTDKTTVKAEEKADPVFGDFISEDIEGNEVSSEIFKGKKVTMVNLWATFCSPCIREMPDLEKLSKDYADKGLQIIGIPCDAYNDELVSQAEDIIKYTGVTYLNILPSATLDEAKLNSVMSVPETVFVDENGVQIGESIVGSKSYEQWAEIIDSVLESAE